MAGTAVTRYSNRILQFENDLSYRLIWLTFGPVVVDEVRVVAYPKLMYMPGLLSYLLAPNREKIWLSSAKPCVVRKRRCVSCLPQALCTLEH